MRTLDQVLAEIVGYYTETDLSLEEATAKASPFTDMDQAGIERALFVGINSLASEDLKYLRRHPVQQDDETTKREYLGRFQLRPSTRATAKGLYANLSIRFDVGGRNLSILDFASEDIVHVRDTYRARAEGNARRAEFFEWLDGELRSRSKARVAELPKSVLTEANKLAGGVFK